MLRWVLESVDAYVEGAAGVPEGPSGDGAWEDVDEAGDLKRQQDTFMSRARRVYSSIARKSAPKNGEVLRAWMRDNKYTVPDLWQNL